VHLTYSDNAGDSGIPQNGFPDDESLSAEGAAVARTSLTLVMLAIAGAMALLLGVSGAAGFTRLMRSLLFGISPLDPITFAAVPIVLAPAAVLASYLPAHRALAVDPVETLRAE
jgi:hypothetical protein